MVEFDGAAVGPSRFVPSCWAAGESTRPLGVDSADCGDRQQATAPWRHRVRRDEGPILPRVQWGGSPRPDAP
eukprot:2828707-Rhodomonas_salina.1